MSNLRNKCEGHGLINRPPMSPYLHDCWWRNEPPTTLKEAKPRKEGVSSEAEASPPPAKSDSFLINVTASSRACSHMSWNEHSSRLPLRDKATPIYN